MFTFLDSTARSAWAAATTQTAQLEGLRDEWTDQVSVRYYSSGGTHLATVTHALPIVDTTTTPRSLRLGAWAAESHIVNGTAAYCVWAVPGGADILRADCSLAGPISDPGGRVRVDIGTVLRVNATASLPATDTPAWATSITVGEWGVVTTTTLASSGVAWTSGGSPEGAGYGYASVISAWGGAVLNTVGFYAGATWVEGPAIVCWGGGHGDYAGNEPYALSLGATPTWYRLRDPTLTGVSNVNEDGSGNPVSRHTYSALSYIPSTNVMQSIGALFRYSDAESNGLCHRFAFGQVSPNSNQPWSKAATAAGGTSVSAYDSALDRIWYAGASGGDVSYYDVAGNTHSVGAFKSPTYSGAPHSAVDTLRGLWAIVSTNAAISFYRTNSGTGNDYYTPTTTGTAPGTGINKSIIYDAVDDRFVVYAGEGKKVYYLTPPASSPYAGGNAWVWSSTTPAGGSTPPTQQTNGTYGRFAPVTFPGARGYVLVNGATDSTYFFRAA